MSCWLALGGLACCTQQQLNFIPNPHLCYWACFLQCCPGSAVHHRQLQSECPIDNSAGMGVYGGAAACSRSAHSANTTKTPALYNQSPRPAAAVLAPCVQDCTLVVLDHCAAVTIDDCTNCRILIGPTESRCVLVQLLSGYRAVMHKQLALPKLQSIRS